MQQQQEPEQQPAAVDFTRWLSPEEMARAQAYAAEVMRQLQERPAFFRGTAEEQARLLRRYAAGLLLAGGRALALAERVEAAGDAAGEPEAEQPPAEAPAATPEPAPPPKRGPGRPRGPRAPGGPMPPPALRARPTTESAAPVPAAPRRPQPTAEEVLANRPAKPPARAGRGL